MRGPQAGVACCCLAAEPHTTRARNCNCTRKCAVASQHARSAHTQYAALYLEWRTAARRCARPQPPRCPQPACSSQPACLPTSARARTHHRQLLVHRALVFGEAVEDAARGVGVEEGQGGVQHLRGEWASAANTRRGCQLGVRVAPQGKAWRCNPCLPTPALPASPSSRPLPTPLSLATPVLTRSTMALCTLVLARSMPLKNSRLHADAGTQRGIQHACAFQARGFHARLALRPPHAHTPLPLALAAPTCARR